MNEHWTDRLSEYLDGELPVEEQRALEAHLATCAACRTVRDELRGVLAATASLEDRGPVRDLWPGIRDRIAETTEAAVIPIRTASRATRRWSLSLAQLAAAAVILVFLSGGAVWLMLRGTGAAPESVASADAGSVTGGSAEMAAQFISVTESSYDAAIRELTARLDAQRAELDPATIEIVERTLGLIDAAIADARTALENDPANGFLYRHLDKTIMKKVDLLRRATGLRSAAT